MYGLLIMKAQLLESEHVLSIFNRQVCKLDFGQVRAKPILKWIFA